MKDRQLERFCWTEGTGTWSQCVDCARREPGRGDVCKAFPKGIPDAIRTNAVSHKKPYPGDHGLQFKAREKESVA